MLRIACRVWLPEWGQEKIKLELRGGAKAALGAADKARSRCPAINLVVQELALELAEANYPFEFGLGWLRGVDNDWADAFSRLSEPGQSYAVPEPLRCCRRRWLEPRGLEWWATRRGKVPAAPRPVMSDVAAAVACSG